jgi:hypothetical protein
MWYLAFGSVKSCSFFFESAGQGVSVLRAGLLADARLPGFALAVPAWLPKGREMPCVWEARSRLPSVRVH